MSQAVSTQWTAVVRCRLNRPHCLHNIDSPRGTPMSIYGRRLFFCFSDTETAVSLSDVFIPEEIEEKQIFFLSSLFKLKWRTFFLQFFTKRLLNSI
jgi:hypothetical protein